MAIISTLFPQLEHLIVGKKPMLVEAINSVGHLPLHLQIWGY